MTYKIHSIPRAKIITEKPIILLRQNKPEILLDILVRNLKRYLNVWGFHDGQLLLQSNGRRILVSIHKSVKNVTDNYFRIDNVCFLR